MGGKRICIRCVMDTTDENIQFTSEGYCNHCEEFLEHMKKEPFSLTKQKKEEKLLKTISKIKREGKRKKYDCVIGVSGGVDSTYLAWKVKQLGLNPIAVHLDNGWNSEIAVGNIEKILKKLKIDLITNVLDWSEFRDIQLSFLKASVPDLEIPTDHAIVSTLYQVASKFNIRWIITGINYKTESILPKTWSNGHYDWIYIKNIQKQFGTKKIKTYPILSMGKYIKYHLLKRQTIFPILNYLEYDKNEATEIIKKLGWEEYGGKHCESNYTKFIQEYILPSKFNYDKRKAHLSNLILSNQISRDEALKILNKKSYDDKEVIKEKRYVANKFNISLDELEKLLKQKNKTYFDYPSFYKNKIYSFALKMYRLMFSFK